MTRKLFNTAKSSLSQVIAATLGALAGAASPMAGLPAPRKGPTPNKYNARVHDFHQEAAIENHNAAVDAKKAEKRANYASLSKGRRKKVAAKVCKMQNNLANGAAA